MLGVTVMISIMILIGAISALVIRWIKSRRNNVNQ